MEWVAGILGVLGIGASFACFFWGKAVGEQEGWDKAQDHFATEREHRRLQLAKILREIAETPEPTNEDAKRWREQSKSF